MTILVALNLPEDEILDISNIKKVKKIKDKVICNFLVSTFDESVSDHSKFMDLTEMTTIENNFPVKIQLPQLGINRLVLENEFVFGNF